MRNKMTKLLDQLNPEDYMEDENASLTLFFKLYICSFLCYLHKRVFRILSLRNGGLLTKRYIKYFSI